MTHNEIITLQEKVHKLLSERRLKEAFGTMNRLIEYLQDWRSNEKLSDMETSYKYMIQYMLEGADDPQRLKIYHQLIFSAYQICDNVVETLLEKSSNNLYYSRKRLQKNHPEWGIPTLIKKIDDDINQHSLSKLFEEKDFQNEQQGKQAILEQDLSELFFSIWTNYPSSENDYKVLKNIFEPHHFTLSVTAISISALLLNLLHIYDVKKHIILFEAYRLNENEEVKQRALCAALIILYVHREQADISEKLKIYFDTLKESPRFATDTKTIFLQLIKSREAEKISKKLTEELLPEMMKISPGLYKKIKQEDLMNDLNPDDKNPEWQELLDNAGITQKLQEMNELQMEGADVFLSTFSQLKNYPFFGQLANWFMPFLPEHSSLRSTFSRSSGEDNFKKLMLHSSFLCNSDKYSFCLTLNQVPESQRNLMMSQFSMEGIELNKIQEEEAFKKIEGNPDMLSNQYIQDLYRFFKLYPQKAEFSDPFRTPIRLNHIQLLKSIFEEDATLRIIGEYYFKKEYYEDALELFGELSVKYHTDSELYQKIGYCYQMLDQTAEALEEYLKAEMAFPNSFWTLRRIASCYRSLKKPEMALGYYTRAQKLKPENLTIEMNIGHCFLEMKDYDSALQHYFKVDFLDPNHKKAWRLIAWCSFLTGKIEQADRYYEKILLENPTALDYMNAGHVSWALNKVKRAIEFYQRSIASDNNNADKFAQNFQQDIPDLIGAGIQANDIPILLDQLMYQQKQGE